MQLNLKGDCVSCIDIKEIKMVVCPKRGKACYMKTKFWKKQSAELKVPYTQWDTHSCHYIVLVPPREKFLQ